MTILYEATPTKYVDPTAYSSSGAGTFANPYVTVAQVQAGFTGDMHGEILAFKRGTTFRTGGNCQLTIYGTSAGGYAQITAYGDAEAAPKLLGSSIVSNWDPYSSDKTLYSITSSSNQEVYYDGSRLQSYSTLALLQAATSGKFWDSSGTKIYIKPPSNENPNLGQVEVTTGTHTLDIRYSNVADAGFIQVSNIDVRYGRNHCLQIAAPDSSGSITSVANLKVINCNFFGSGVDGVSSLGADGVSLYGLSDAVRATGIYAGSNTFESLLNNSVEIAFATAPIVENNTATTCGGNVWAEFWASVSSGIVRYNKGYTASTSGRLTTTYHAGAFWSTIWTASGGSSPDHTKNVSNEIYGNLGYDLQLQGIEIYGGTGHKVHGNTLVNCRNRGINMFTNVATAGTCDAEVNNNLVIVLSGGNHVPIDVQQGTANNAAGVSIVSTLTGDKNLYRRSNGGAMNFRVNNSATTSFTTYKTNASPFDANARNGDPSLDTSYRPQSGSDAINNGAAVTGWVMDLDGESIRGTPTIGAYQLPIDTGSSNLKVK